MIDDFKSLEMIPNNPSIWVDRKTKEPISGLEPGEWKHIDREEFIRVFVGHLYATGYGCACRVCMRAPSPPPSHACCRM